MLFSDERGFVGSVFVMLSDCFGAVREVELGGRFALRSLKIGAFFFFFLTLSSSARKREKIKKIYY